MTDPLIRTRSEDGIAIIGRARGRAGPSGETGTQVDRTLTGKGGGAT